MPRGRSLGVESDMDLHNFEVVSTLDGAEIVIKIDAHAHTIDRL